MFGEDTPNIVKWIGQFCIGSLMAITVMYLGAEYYTNRDASLAVLNTPVQLLSASDLKQKQAFEPGDNLVFVLDVTKHDIDCFAEYVMSFSGPVNFQRSVGKSFVFPKESGGSTKAVIKSLVTLPSELPNGAYSAKLIAYPVCSGWSMDPYVMGNSPPVLVQHQ